MFRIFKINFFFGGGGCEGEGEENLVLKWSISFANGCSLQDKRNVFHSGDDHS